MSLLKAPNLSVLFRSEIALSASHVSIHFKEGWLRITNCYKDPLLMNAFNGVNLSAACVLTSTDVAEKLGISKDKWVYVLGGAGTHEQEDCKF